MTGISDDVVFITGATAGMGTAFARRFIDEGARVIATGRRADRLDALKQELGDRLHTAVVDVRDRDSVEQCVSALPDDFAKISVLINNAGLSLGGGTFYEDDLDDMLTMIDTNIKGVVHVTRTILPGMVERDRGHVFNMGSVGGVYTVPGEQHLWLHQVIHPHVHARSSCRTVGEAHSCERARARRSRNRLLRGSCPWR